MGRKNKRLIVKEKKDISKRKPYFNDFYADMKTLIVMRNRNGYYIGYREMLLYLVRERAIWSGYTIDESVKLALELNQMMHDPKPKIQIENRCRPSPGRMTSSFDKIIDKLNITLQEQKKLKVLKRRWLKKSAYAKRKRKCKLSLC